MLCNIECRVESVQYTCLWGSIWTILEVELHVVEESADDIIRVIQDNEHVIWYWKVTCIRHVGHCNHLGLLESRPQVEIVKVLVKGQEAYSGSITSWKRAFIYCSFDGGSCLLKVSRIDSFLRDIKDKDVGGWHWRSIHVFLGSNQIN